MSEGFNELRKLLSHPTMVDEWLNNEDEYKTYVPDINLQDEAPRTCLVCHTSNFTEFMYLQLRCQPKRCKVKTTKAERLLQVEEEELVASAQDILEHKRTKIGKLDTCDREHKHTTARPTARSGHGGTTSNSKPTITSASVICYCSKCGSKYVSERRKLRSEEATPGSMGETSHFLEDEKDERNRPTFHVCKNDCVLYTGDLMGATECPKCRETRFDDRGKAKKEYFYFPLLETVSGIKAILGTKVQPHQWDDHRLYARNPPGITKGLMSLWFKSGRKEEYYCGHHLQESDNILLEVDIITNRQRHEREDHNHIMKRIAKHTRDDGHADINSRGDAPYRLSVTTPNKCQATTPQQYYWRNTVIPFLNHIITSLSDRFASDITDRTRPIHRVLDRRPSRGRSCP
ncbi:hypothetical protein Bbelb_048910 [Branchiostoma belcheri]|nr:hypothetical protein Bbelb_048910 [Branchiostoma belcheri]